MRTLVTGATGFIGRRLVQGLLVEGHHVTVLTRRPSAALARLDSRVRVIGGDLTSGELGLPGDVESVIHCAGTQGRMNAHNVNVDGTRAVIEFAVGTPSVQRLVYLSSVGVIGPTGFGVVNETADCAPSNEYEASKLEAERLVLDSNGSGLVCTALRPSIVFGYRPPDKSDSFRQLISAVAAGHFRLIGSGSGYYNLVYVDDVSAALIELLGAARPLCAGRAFILNDAIRWDAFAKLVSAITNAPVTRSVGPLVAFPLAVVGTVATRLGVRFPLTVSRYHAMTSKTRFSSELIEREIGFRFPYGTERGVRMTVGRYAAEARVT